MSKRLQAVFASFQSSARRTARRSLALAVESAWPMRALIPPTCAVDSLSHEPPALALLMAGQVTSLSAMWAIQHDCQATHRSLSAKPTRQFQNVPHAATSLITAACAVITARVAEHSAREQRALTHTPLAGGRSAHVTIVISTVVRGRPFAMISPPTFVG